MQKPSVLEVKDRVIESRAPPSKGEFDFLETHGGETNPAGAPAAKNGFFGKLKRFLGI